MLIVELDLELLYNTKWTDEKDPTKPKMVSQMNLRIIHPTLLACACLGTRETYLCTSR